MGIEISHSGKAALVTGAGAGIGRQTAIWMARAGADIAIIEKRAKEAEAVAEEIAGLGVKVHIVLGDARDDERLCEMVAESAEKMGGLDFAVNNIGMLGPEGSGSWLDMTPSQFRDAIEQNLILTAVACQKQAQIMKENFKGDFSLDAGVILNISSGETTRPSPHLAGYGAAKAGINHLTQTLAVELGAYAIRVNAIAPGTTRTEQIKSAFSDEQYQKFVDATPLKRETYPEELARLAVFLTSDLARCITGQLILADAGAHLSRSRPSL